VKSQTRESVGGLTVVVGGGAADARAGDGEAHAATAAAAAHVRTVVAPSFFVVVARLPARLSACERDRRVGRGEKVSDDVVSRGIIISRWRGRGGWGGGDRARVEMSHLAAAANDVGDADAQPRRERVHAELRRHRGPRVSVLSPRAKIWQKSNDAPRCRLNTDAPRRRFRSRPRARASAPESDRASSLNATCLRARVRAVRLPRARASDCASVDALFCKGA